MHFLSRLSEAFYHGEELLAGALQSVGFVLLFLVIIKYLYGKTVPIELCMPVIYLIILVVKWIFSRKPNVTIHNPCAIGQSIKTCSDGYRPL